mmetsp:Transcript_54675/g.105589  ORF Transcript_54675/g.105589 Transcript_54675/m.105589 type:complete len:106 (+) Transcript_54675:271-588(+)
MATAALIQGPTPHMPQFVTLLLHTFCSRKLCVVHFWQLIASIVRQNSGTWSVGKPSAFDGTIWRAGMYHVVVRLCRQQFLGFLDSAAYCDGAADLGSVPQLCTSI